MSGDAVTLGAVRRLAAKRLTEAETVDTPALDARLLIAAVVGMAPNELVLADYRAVSMDESARIDAMLERRAAGEPVARILGAREFWGLSFNLQPATLVPRPDSETVIEAALGFIDRTGGRERPLRLVDIGTGSGALLVALLSELPNAVGLGIDLSEAAARAARDNADRLGFGARSLFVCGDFAACARPADVVVSNPPYIESAVIATLPAEVRDFDPRLALDGGADGLDAYRVIIPPLTALLDPAGAAFLEIGFDQGDAVQRLAVEAGFAAALHRDLSGHDRVVEVAPA
ncbi:peptide chain release factor N(5)-glutamine methyltransferase [Mesorhizobium sp. BR1-1-16]|uniref:peptide chain release factor N(5)-glutamine methyltransferase n=1 Tax=Mesorhizobium sp. BR1-1-16 TaxID=2876653 RepID=UPI001CCED488|nr:peptide chain release factor N(5)-glutamine methyltransferase [Mesorhizobium sp. BR1-1-16]MBZ9939388.1 peptide chain release factor N(5)-glutamine methyltransferase [Mesorhizobium sp. BR1-1-16]